MKADLATVLFDQIICNRDEAVDLDIAADGYQKLHRLGQILGLDHRTRTARSGVLTTGQIETIDNQSLL